MKRRIIITAAALLIVLSITTDARSQYFGRNRVQYDSFEFQVMKTEHFDIYFYPEKKELVDEVARMAERWYARLSKIFDHELSTRQVLILYAAHPHFQQTNVLSGGVSEGTGGVTEAFKRRIVMPAAGPLASTDHVLGHELVHAFQYDIAGIRGPVISTSSGMFRLPLWFIEGMAEYLSVGSYDPHTAMWMRDAAQKEDGLPTLGKMASPRYFPYRYGQAFWAFLASRYGDEMVSNIFRAAVKSGDAEQTLRVMLQIEPDSLASRWHQSIRGRADSLKTQRDIAEQDDSALLANLIKESGLYLAPSISPDGKKIAFISTDDLYALNYQLAEVESGRILRNLTETAMDPHLQSIQFLYSSGSWDHTGDRFAIAVVSKGEPAFKIVNLKPDHPDREIQLSGLDEIYSPGWSPDGRSLVFSGLSGGMLDLYIYDLEKETLRRLTSDPYTELQPAWSPDGRSIAFSTDRYTTDLKTLDFGILQLALYDLDTGEVQAIPGLPDGKAINPQWSPDGESLYFVSDGSGISNIYRIERSSGTLFQVTDLYTGASGITATSPLLSVASNSGDLVYSAYHNGGYVFRRIKNEIDLAGTPLRASYAGIEPGALTGPERRSEMVSGLLENPNFGLQESVEHDVVDYSPRLTLDYIAPPSVGGGADQFGAFIYGGTSLLWSDMLGDFQLITGLQINGDFRTIGAQLGYLNRKNRLNWGVIAQQTPLVYNAYAGGLSSINDEAVFVDQELRLKQTNRGISGIASYPFSTTQRIELSAGYSRISFSQELKTIATSVFDGREIVNEKQDLPSPDPLHLARFSSAYVYDNALYGPTSPIRGQRYRFEISPNFGTLQYQTLLADMRRYAVPKQPFTLAFRLLHFGNYGADAENGLLGPLYLGYQGFIRGYNSGSFGFEENSSFDFNRLLGSKMLISNIEIRFPLFGLFGLGDRYYGPLPIETAAFFDAGLAWTGADKAAFLGGGREPLRSYGLALRLNLFGFAVLELDYVRPIDRPQKGWMWQFGLTPGF